MDYRLLSLLFCNGLQFTIFALPSPFYPVEAENMGVPLWMIGIILASNSILSALIAPFIGKYLEKIRRKRAFVSSVLISGIGICSWGILEYVNLEVFIVISFVGRIFQGLGFTLAAVSGLSIIASDYSHDVARMVSYMEISCGLGMIAGPLIGSFLYYFAGFAITFFAYSCIFFICLPIFYCTMPADRDYVKQQSEPIDYGKLTKKPLIIIQLLSIFVTVFTYTSLDAVLSIYLDDQFGIRGSLVGVFFAAHLISYMVGSIITGCIQEKFPKSKIIMTGLFMSGIALFLAGPCTGCGIPENIWIIIVGLVILGIGNATLYVPILPYMLELAYNRYGYENDDMLSDFLSASISTAISLACTAGPIISTLWVEFWTFQDFFSLCGGIVLIFEVIYIVTLKIGKPHVKVERSDTIAERLIQEPDDYICEIRSVARISLDSMASINN